MENIGRLISIIQRRMGGIHVPAEIFHIQAVTNRAQKGYGTEVTAQLSVFNDDAGPHPEILIYQSLLKDEKFGWFDLELKGDDLFLNNRKITLLPCRDVGHLDKIIQNSQVLGYGVQQAICINTDPRDRPYFIPKKWSDLKGGWNENVNWDLILFPGTIFKEKHSEKDGGGKSIGCMAMRSYDGYWGGQWFKVRDFDEDGKETTDWGSWYEKKKKYVAILEP